MANNTDQKRVALLQLAANNIIGLYELAEMLFTSQIFGYPGSLKKNLSKYFDRNLVSLEGTINDITGEDLKRSLDRILQITRSLITSDDNLRICVENLTGYPMTKIRKTTRLSIQKKDATGLYSGDASLPSWVKERAYVELFQESADLMKNFVKELEIVFTILVELSNGAVENWLEEQNRKGRFQYIFDG